MKKLIALFVAILIISSFASCAKDDATTTSVVEVYSHRTLAFFQSMAESDTFYYKATITKVTGTTYSYAQATDGRVTTTIRDNSYEIYSNGSDGKRKIIHQVNLSGKRYDTIINREGEDFLFSGYNYTQFTAPVVQKEEEFNGKTYYCEYFKANVSADSHVEVYDKYYYDANTLVAIVTPAVTMYIEEYSTEIPSHVYLTPPSDFTRGNLTEETVIDYSDLFND